MRRRPPSRGLAGVLVAIVLVAVACGGEGETLGSPGATAATGSTGATGAATGTTGATGITGAVTGATGVATGATGVATGTTGPAETGCVPEAPTSSGWQTHPAMTGDFTFSYPPGWEDASGDIGATAGELLSSDTLAELGLTGTEPALADVVRDPVTGDNLGVFRFEGATSSTEDVYARHESLYSMLTGVEVTATGLTACVDGAAAKGLELGGIVSGEGQRYQQLWFVVHGGTLYHFYIDAADPAAAEILHEVIRTWLWTV